MSNTSKYIVVKLQRKDPDIETAVLINKDLGIGNTEATGYDEFDIPNNWDIVEILGYDDMEGTMTCLIYRHQGM